MKKFIRLSAIVIGLSLCAGGFAQTKSAWVLEHILESGQSWGQETFSTYQEAAKAKKRILEIHKEQGWKTPTINIQSQRVSPDYIGGKPSYPTLEKQVKGIEKEGKQVVKDALKYERAKLEYEREDIDDEQKSLESETNTMTSSGVKLNEKIRNYNSSNGGEDPETEAEIDFEQKDYLAKKTEIERQKNKLAQRITNFNSKSRTFQKTTQSLGYGNYWEVPVVSYRQNPNKNDTSNNHFLRSDTQQKCPGDRHLVCRHKHS